MSLVDFSGGVSSRGVPLLGGAFTLPRMGGRIAGSSEDAKVFFVDPANGSDSNLGEDPGEALDTVSAAYAKTVDKRGDVIYLLNDGNTSGTSREDATITWSNDNTHLVGWCAPSLMSQRARISPTTTLGSIVTPQLTVSGNGCMFANFSLFEGDDQDGTASICVNVTGDRNYFWNVAMMNMGDAATGNSGDEAASYHLQIDGGEENVFERCYIGLDTANRTAANANLHLDNSATRNAFYHCFFPMRADAADPLFVKITGTDGIDRFVLFDNCIFHNFGTTLTQAMSVPNSLGGNVIIKDCMAIGATEWDANDNAFTNSPAGNVLGGIGVTVAGA